MGLNTTKFMKQQFQQRIDDVEVPALADWFDKPKVADGDTPPVPVWTVRGLTANELSKTFEAANKTKTLDSVIQAISSSQAKIDELKEVLGVGDDVSSEIMKRIEQLVRGSVDPEIDHSVAQKIAEKFPIEFYTLTNKITLLTGLGMDVKK